MLRVISAVLFLFTKADVEHAHLVNGRCLAAHEQQSAERVTRHLFISAINKLSKRYFPPQYFGFVFLSVGLITDGYL